MEDIADNIARLQDRIAVIAERCGRGPDEVTLVAVTKRQPVAALLAALAAGVGDLGENYVQEAEGKRALLWPAQAKSARWHLIGHLQSNKAKDAVRTFDLIQSVDSVGLASRLGREARSQNQAQEILLQVHLGDEETKSGLPPEQVPDTVLQVIESPGITLRGLMGIAPQGVDPRPHFRTLRRLFETLPAETRQILSMGMTGDYETAIEEGATMVRVGTALFGSRRE